MLVVSSTNLAQFCPTSPRTFLRSPSKGCHLSLAGWQVVVYNYGIHSHRLIYQRRISSLLVGDRPSSATTAFAGRGAAAVLFSTARALYWGGARDSAIDGSRTIKINHTNANANIEKNTQNVGNRGNTSEIEDTTTRGSHHTSPKTKTTIASNSNSNSNSMEDDFRETADRIQDLALGGGGGRGGRNRRGGGGGGRRGGGGGGGGGGQNRQVQISKALSLLLRHQAHSAGIKLDAEGYAPLDRVLQWPRLRSLNPSVAEIKEEVATNAKQRFSLKPKNLDSDSSVSSSTGDAAHWLIRANQGHSIALASEGLHTPITLEAGNVPDVVVHGTYFAFWPAIVAAGGLKKMGRTHVHFGTGVPGDEGKGQVHDVDDEANAAESNKPKVISGMRADAELLIFVDVKKALLDNVTSTASSSTAAATSTTNENEDAGEENTGGEIKWWMSENNVVLTEGNAEGLVPLKYFKEVSGRRQGVGLLWKDGEKVADLPDGVVARVPQGKGRASGGAGGERGGRGGRRGRGRGS
ncbi:KptA family-domain-containing protein [Xylariaceae sp. AK1471]|nr:KptA family-domain-containing protein [Xylariaceae sp. AK1471]